MSEAVGALLAALGQAATDAAGAAVAPVSVQLDWTAPQASALTNTMDALAEISVQRVTRTLVFLQGDWLCQGARQLTAVAVFRIV